ncbi:MAG: hypothetical protein R3F56_00660 [Planctomycetota bacterium]
MTATPRAAVALLAAASVVVAAGFWVARREVGSSASVPSPGDSGAAPDVVPLQASLPPECERRYPPHTTVRFERSFAPRDFGSGIACPGGGYLPLLNGVPRAPTLNRDVERFGPVPPVVGMHTDADGDEWWVHADGSETTSRWTTVTVGGVPRRDVRTDHTVPAPEGHGLPPDAPARDR